MISTTLSSADVRRHVAGLIAAGQPAINARLSKIVPNLGVARIEPAFTRNVDSGSFPIVMIEQLGTSSRWEAMPNVAKIEFRMNIWGFVHWDDDGILDDLAAELAAGVADCLNMRHRPSAIEGTDVMMYFDDTVPMSSVNFGAGMMAGAVVKGFSAEFKCHTLQSITDRLTPGM